MAKHTLPVGWMSSLHGMASWIFFMGVADRFFENKKERMMSVCLIGGNPNKTFKYAKLDISIQMKRYITDLKILHFQIQT